MEESNIIYQDAIRRHVDAIRRWYKFFAVVSIVLSSLYLVSGVLLIVFGDGINRILGEQCFALPMGIVNILVMAVLVPAIIYLFKGAKAGKVSVALNNPADMVAFMRWSKHFWKYCGIVTIVVLGLSVLYIVATVIFLLSHYSVI